MEKNYPVSPAAIRLNKLACLFAFCLALFSVHSSKAQLELLQDISTGAVQHYDPYYSLISGSDKVFFVKNSELWMSRGSSTALVKKFRAISSLVVFGSVVYFNGDDGNTGAELWVSDGTAAGTKVIAELYPGAPGGNPQNIVVTANNTIYFSAHTPSGRELWKSNGTATGTSLVKDIMGGSGSSNPRGLTAIGNTLFFSANNGSLGYELWKTDGTAGGTVMVKDVRPGEKVSSNPEWLTAANGKLFFRANDGVAGVELWVSDGTSAGTVRVKDIRPGTANGDVENLINVNGTLFFTANNGINGDELWKSDGTASGTVLVKDLNPGSAGSNNTSAWRFPMGNFTNMNGLLYFTAGKGSSEEFIVRSDGTEAGTVIITDADSQSLNALKPRFTFLNGYVYFFNYNVGLYRVSNNGTAVEEVMSLSAPEDYYEDFTPEMTALGASLYFTSYSVNGWSVVKFEPATGNRQVIDEDPAPSIGSNPHTFTRAGNYLYFYTEPDPGYNSYPSELWRTDGTPEGTLMVYELSPNQNEMVALGDKLVFATDGTIFITSGSPETTIALHVFPEAGAYVGNLTNVNGIVYFDNNMGQVWKTDGTPAGTTMVRALNDIQNITNVNGKAFILNENTGGGLELWRTNATGLLLVKVIRQGPGRRPFYPLAVAAGSWFYFVANDGVHGNEVWRSDGTAFGTQLTMDFNTSDPVRWVNEDDIRSMTVLQGKVYVSALGEDGNWKMYSMFKNNAPVNLGNMQPVEKTIVMGYRMYLFPYRTVSDPYQELWVYDLLGGSQFQKLYGEVGWGTVSAVELNGFLYFSTEYYPVPKQITACGIKDVPTGTSRAWPMAGLGNDLVFANYGDGIGVEPYAYHNIYLISEDCNASGDAARVASNDMTFKPYPNPYTNSFTMFLEGEEGSTADVSVFNSSGMPVEKFENIEFNIDHTNVGEGWPKGIYLVKVTKDGVTTTHRVIKK